MFFLLATWFEFPSLGEVAAGRTILDLKKGKKQ